MTPAINHASRHLRELCAATVSQIRWPYKQDSRFWKVCSSVLLLKWKSLNVRRQVKSFGPGTQTAEFRSLCRSSDLINSSYFNPSLKSVCCLANESPLHTLSEHVMGEDTNQRRPTRHHMFTKLHTVGELLLGSDLPTKNFLTHALSDSDYTAPSNSPSPPSNVWCMRTIDLLGGRPLKISKKVVVAE